MVPHRPSSVRQGSSVKYQGLKGTSKGQERYCLGKGQGKRSWLFIISVPVSRRERTTGKEERRSSNAKERETHGDNGKRQVAISKRTKKKRERRGEDERWVGGGRGMNLRPPSGHTKADKGMRREKEKRKNMRSEKIQGKKAASTL